MALIDAKWLHALLGDGGEHGPSTDPIRRVMETLSHHFQADGSHLFIREGDRFHLGAHTGLPESFTRSIATTTFDQFPRLAEFHMDRERIEVREGRIHPLAKAIGLQTCLSLPLANTRGHWSTLVLYSRRIDAFPDSEMETLRALQPLLSLSLESHRRFMEYRDARHRAQLLIESSFDGIFEGDAEGRLVFCNRRFAELFGYTPEEIQGMRYLDRIPAEDHAALRQTLREWLRHRAPQIRVTVRLLHRDGRTVECEAQAVANLNADGRFVGFFGYLHDVTERLRTARALRESEERYALAARGSNEGLWDWNLETGEIYYSPRCREMLGLTEEEFPGTPEAWRNRVHPADFDRMMAGIRDHLKGRTPLLRNEHRLRHKDGSWRWILEKGVGLRGGNGRVHRMAGSWTDVTERRQAEEALRESRRALETLIANLPGIAYRCRNEPDWPMEFISQGVYPITGHAAEEFSGPDAVRYGDLIHPDDRGQVWDDVQTALAERRPFRLNYRVVHHSGEIRRVWEQGAGVFGPEGELVALEGFIADVTERVQAEDRLRLSEERLRTIVTNAPVVLFAYDPEGRFTLSEGRGLEKLGLTPGQVVGQSVAEIYRDFPDIVANIRRALAGQEFQSINTVGGISFQVWHHPVRDADGRLQGVIGLALDITERLAVERELRESEAQWRALSENVPDFICIIDRELRFRSVNRYAPGLSAEKVLGRCLLDFVEPTMREKYRQQIDVVFGTGQPAHFECMGTGWVEPMEWYENRVTPIFHEGRIESVCCITTNIHALKKAQRRAEEAREAMEAKTREMEIVFDQVAHDLRNPVFAANGYAEMLARQMNSWLEGNEARYLDNIRRSLDHIMRLVSDLQDVSQAGKTEFVPSVVRLDPWIRHLAEEFAPRLAEHAVSLTVESIEGEVWFDPRRLYQVLSNLIANAIKFTRGRPNPRVALGASSENGRTRIVVEDNGIGIALADQAVIFEPFRRVAGLEVEGSGVGLAIVRRLVERGGGTVGVHSETGRGSRFTVDLPAGPPGAGNEGTH